MSLLRLMPRTLRSVHPSPLTPRPLRTIHIRASPIQAFPRKGSQDKDSIDTAPTEYSKSGSDPGAAQSDTAFDPNTTTPEGQEKQAAQESVSACTAICEETEMSWAWIWHVDGFA
jgi:hypothetical protein